MFDDAIVSMAVAVHSMSAVQSSRDDARVAPTTVVASSSQLRPPRVLGHRRRPVNAADDAAMRAAIERGRQIARED